MPVEPPHETQPAPPVPVVLPGSLAEALGQEYRRITRAPYETLLTVSLNGALMSSAWFFLPTKLVDALFELHGSIAFAFVLSSWMYSDVPATNVLACDAARTLAAIDQPQALKRILAARRLVLWTLVAPLCMLLTFIMGAGKSDPVIAVYSVVAIAIVPFGVLAVSGWVGILFPYHPIPVTFRWRQRRRWWPMLGRWLTLVLLPYGLVPALSLAFMAPTLLIWGLTSTAGLSQKLPHNDVGLGLALACAIALAAVYLGQRTSLRLVARRRGRLVAYLSDPTRG